MAATWQISQLARRSWGLLAVQNQSDRVGSDGRRPADDPAFQHPAWSGLRQASAHHRDAVRLQLIKCEVALRAGALSAKAAQKCRWPRITHVTVLQYDTWNLTEREVRKCDSNISQEVASEKTLGEESAHSSFCRWIGLSCNQFQCSDKTTYITILLSYVDFLSMQMVYNFCKNDRHPLWYGLVCKWSENDSFAKWVSCVLQSFPNIYHTSNIHCAWSRRK